MCETLIFGGTTEGRALAELCAKNGIPAFVCVTTDYGASLLRGVKVLTGRMTEAEMLEFITKNHISLVLDATHPYAREATANIRRACESAGTRLLRVLREWSGEEWGRYFDDMSGIISYLAETDGNVLVTTGSKELAAFCALKDYRARCAVRVLPSGAGRCAELGFDPRRVIAAAGPFTKEQNAAHIKKFAARFIVTKDSGAAGGFGEKLAAAREHGAEALILRRPAEDGVSLAEAEKILLGGGHE